MFIQRIDKIKEEFFGLILKGTFQQIGCVVSTFSPHLRWSLSVWKRWNIPPNQLVDLHHKDIQAYIHENGLDHHQVHLTDDLDEEGTKTVYKNKRFVFFITCFKTIFISIHPQRNRKGKKKDKVKIQSYFNLEIFAKFFFKLLYF